jgi:allantoicase
VFQSSGSVDQAALAECCGSRRWQELMAGAAPFASSSEALMASERAFDALSRTDWMQAFAAHSTIGVPRPGDATGAREQAGLDRADGELRTALAAANLEYQTRFGFVFLIRARGRGADEMLGALHARLENPPETEFRIASEQQRQITALRLEDLMAAGPAPVHASEGAVAPDGAS